MILASQSRARQTLLANAGLSFEAIAAEIDERAIQQTSNLSAPSEIALLLAREKALWVSSRKPGQYVIGADQTLALGHRLFDKPRDRGQALDQLRALAGHTEIAAYLDEAGEAVVTSSVGGYQLEGLGVHLFERIEGDHFTILGLPLLPLLGFLRGQRLLAI